MSSQVLIRAKEKNEAGRGEKHGGKGKGQYLMGARTGVTGKVTFE